MNILCLLMVVVMLELNDISFGKIISDILTVESITDLMIWDKELWVSDISKGHYQYSIDQYSNKEKEEFINSIYKLPRQIAIRMEVPYNDSNPIIDGEGIFDTFGQLRFNCIHENLTSDGYPALAIRKSLASLRINKNKMMESGYIDQDFFSLMQMLVLIGCNILISGITGSGKTELLRYLVRFIPSQEAIVTIEDTLETYIKQVYPTKNVLALKTNRYVGLDDLLKCSLRQNPDWICISETRGKEVLRMLEAISTGHHLISTIHCDSAYNIPLRIYEMSSDDIKQSEKLNQMIFNHIDIGIHISYYNDERGSHRKISEIVEYYLDVNQKPKVNTIYEYDYKSGTGFYNKIVSEKIKRKAKQRDIDLFGND